MKILRRFFARLSNLTAANRDDRRLREEMEEHIAQQTADNLRAGIAPAEARRQAALKFGAAGAIREQYHSESGLPFLETLLRDLRYALRQLSASPGFASIAITAVLVVVALAACYIPARRAMRVDPIVALREA